MAKPNIYEANNWDLEDLLKGKSLDSLYQQWIKLNEQIIEQSKDFYKTLSNFRKWEKLGEEEEKISNRLSNYVSNKMSEDVSDQKYMAWEQKISSKSHEFGEKLAGLTQVVIANETKIRSYLKNKDLKEKTLGYERIFRYKPHILSTEVSKALSKISKNNSAVSSIFSTLTTEDIKFPDAKDSKGKAHKIETMSVVSTLLKSKDRVLRKNTWLSFHKSFNNFQSTLTQTLFYNYTQLNTHAKLKNFKDYIDATCFSDEIEFKLVQKIYDNVLKYKPLHKEYTDLTSYFLKEQLKLKKIEPWDLGVDLNKVEFKYTLDEARNIILDCLSILGSEYTNNLTRAFNEKWISFMPKKNKYTGAYSIGETFGLDKYYLLMNFNGTFDSVSTLSHELGHSMNSLYYGKKQKEYADTTIFTAEIPSILNETLLGMYMIEKYKDNKKAQRNFIRELLVNFFGCTTRQIVFSNFEYVANQWVNEAKPFTKETVRKLYLDMTEKYIGIKNLKKTTSEPYSYALSTILRISHFYAGNFYVYKYAVGQIVAINVAKQILDGDKDIKTKLFKFLESGISRSPLETIKLLGVDMTTDKPYIEAGKFVKKLLEMYKKTK